MHFWKIWWIVLGFAVSMIFAQSNMSEAEAILSKSAVYFREAQSLSFEFKVDVHYEVSDEDVSYAGDLLIGQSDRFRLQTQGQAYYCDGVTLWQYNESQKQVLIKSLLDLESAFHPTEVLFKYLRCKPISMKSDKWKGKPVYVLQLDPKEYIRAFKAMEVWLNPDDYSPVRLLTVDVTGNKSVYEISKLTRNEKVSESDFVFKTPAGVQEFDMR